MSRFRFASSCRRWLLIAAALGTGIAQADPWGLPELMQSLSSVQARELNYVETKHLAALDTPLVSEGRLASSEDGALQMEVYTPKWAQYIITDDTFTILTEGKPTREIELADQPQLAAFAAAFRAVRQGDLPTLQQFYELVLQGDDASWQLSLKPRDAEMASRIAEIRLAGSGGLIASITTQQTDGDRSEMRLTPVN